LRRYIQEFGAVKALAIVAGGIAVLITLVFVIIWVTYTIQDRKYEREQMEKQRKNDIPIQRNARLG
jgi:hypothetical protein